MPDKPPYRPLPRGSGEMRAVDVVEGIPSIPPPAIDPEVDRRLRAIEDGHGVRIKTLEDDFRGQRDGLTAHVNTLVTAAVDAKLTEKIAPLRAQITTEFTQQNGTLAEILVFMKASAGRMHKLTMDSSHELTVQHEPIDKRIDGKRKHTLAVIATACTVVTVIAGLIGMAINSQRGGPVVAPHAAEAEHH